MMAQMTHVLNGSFHALTFAETVDAIFCHVGSAQTGWLCTVNVSTLMRMRRDPALQSMVDRAALVVADGQPIVWYSRLLRRRLPERVTGIDLVSAICARAQETGARVYLLGSTHVLLERAIASLKATYPGLRIEGSDGYFTPADAPARADAIRAAQADILIVGMGSPRQEEFIERYCERTGVKIAMGAGGSFDVLAGARFRAPLRVQKAGLEWVVRLAQEPRRLLPRYVRTNSEFCYLIIVDAAKRAFARKAKTR